MSTIATIYLFPRVTKVVPSALAALVVLTLVSTLMKLDVAIIGDIPDGFPKVLLGELGNVGWLHPMAIFIPALTLAALGTIDSLLTSIVADNMTKTRHNNNKELVGQGLGNMAAVSIAGIPGAGATMRTVVNINSGGKTRISGVIHGFSLLLVLLGAGAYAKLIPLPVLAGILITVGIGIIDYKGIKHIVDVLRSDAVGMVLSSVLFMKKMSDIAEAKTFGSGVEDAHQVETETEVVELTDDIRHKVFVKSFDGPIFFGFASKFQEMTEKSPDVDVVILRMGRVPYIDQSGLYAIEDTVLALQEKKILVLITEIQEQPKDMLSNVGLIPEIIPEAHLYPDFNFAIKALRTGEAFEKVPKKEKFSWSFVNY